MRILVTGHKNGLGKYFFEKFDAIGWDKDISSKQVSNLKKKGVDIIIHCAFNSSPEVDNESLFTYLQDNVFLTKELVSIPHKKFIFFSSVDVYPKDKDKHSEKEIINLNSVENIYGITKLISESIVKNYSKNYLILRCSAFLGKYSRKNSLIKIIEKEKCKLTLDKNSEFNYILYEDVLNLIQKSIKRNLKGVYNLASSQNIKIYEIAKIFNRKVKFGNYHYNSGKIDNRKTCRLDSNFKKTSKEIINIFIKEKK